MQKKLRETLNFILKKAFNVNFICRTLIFPGQDEFRVIFLVVEHLLRREITKKQLVKLHEFYLGWFDLKPLNGE